MDLMGFYRNVGNDFSNWFNYPHVMTESEVGRFCLRTQQNKSRFFPNNRKLTFLYKIDIEGF